MAIMIRGSNLQFLISMFFIFSIMYTMYFYYQSAQNDVVGVSGLDDIDDNTKMPTSTKDNSNWLGNLISGVTENTLDFVLELLSWFSPFIFLKAMLKVLVPTDLYQFINLILLRPIGWIGTYITSDYVLNKIRGVSE